ncbi:MAG: hypothetical protein ACREXR_17155, partial [Gammaproteobacteria bacterium]
MKSAAVEVHPVGYSTCSIPFSSNVLSGVVAIADAFVVFLAGMLIYLVHVGWSNESAPVYASGCAVTALLIAAVFYGSGLYELNPIENRAIRYRKIVAGCGWVFLAIIVLAFALKISERFSRIWLFSWFI